MIQRQILRVQVLNLSRIFVHFSDNILKNSSKFIHFLKRFHQISFDIVTLEYQILLVSTGNIQLAADIGRICLLPSHLLLELLIVVPGSLQVLLHGLIRHVDFIFLVRDALKAFVVYFYHSELANEIVLLAPQLLHVVIYAVQTPLQGGIVHHHRLNAVYVELITHLRPHANHITDNWLRWWRIILHGIQCDFGGCRWNHVVIFVW